MSTISRNKIERTSNSALNVTCRQLPRLLLLTLLLTCSLSATMIQFHVATNGSTGTYQYFISGFAATGQCPNNTALTCSNEIDIQFAPTVFSQISNGVATAGFSLLLFQPNNPPQAAGDYSALAIVSNPSLAGPFSVDFTLAAGGTPGAQAFFIESFDSFGFFEGFAEQTGATTQQVVGNVPEPASLLLIVVGLISGGVFLLIRLWAERAGRHKLIGRLIN